MKNVLARIEQLFKFFSQLIDKWMKLEKLITLNDSWGKHRNIHCNIDTL